MLNQHSTMINNLFSLSDKISYVVLLNLMGDVIYEHYKDAMVTRKDCEKLTNSFNRIITATSLLNFDNVKFLIYEEDNHKNIIVNLQETSVIICFRRESSLSDVLDILNEVVTQY